MQPSHFGFLLANHDRRAEVDVDNDYEFVVAGLEEEVLDIAEEEVCFEGIRQSSRQRDAAKSKRETFTDPLSARYAWRTEYHSRGSGGHRRHACHRVQA